MRIESFDDAVRYLEGQEDMKSPNLRENRLERMRLLLKRIGSPERSFKSIHVAGSKGKGSVSAYIAAGLDALGLKTGLYLSPHLEDIRERFTLAGRFFPTDFLISTAERMREMLEGFELPECLGPRRPTVFEAYTLYSYLLFSLSGCEYAVIETGLGGRLDATNTLSPIACVFTPIELEHTEILGDTIERIATEKSKIIAKDALVFSSRQKDDALRVIKAEAESKGNAFIPFDAEVASFKAKAGKDGETVSFRLKDGFEGNYALKMKGRAQAENAMLATIVLRRLNLFDGEKSKGAIEHCFLPGRFEEVIGDDGIFILDSAHTKRSMENTIETFRALYDGRKSVCIFGSILGKDSSGMLSMILSGFDAVIISRPGTYKESNVEALFVKAKEIAKGNKTILLRPDARCAYNEALGHLKEGGAVLITGSFYLSGEFRSLINGA